MNAKKTVKTGSASAKSGKPEENKEEKEEKKTGESAEKEEKNADASAEKDENEAELSPQEIVLQRRQNVTDALRAVVVVFVCLCVNVFGDFFAQHFSLPAWLDSFGTVFSSYLLGPLCGAVVGVSTNVILSFWDPSSLAYAVTSLMIALSIGIAARKKYFDTFHHAMTVAGFVTIVSVVISSILNIIFTNGSTGNIWGDGVRDYMLMKGLPSALATLIGQLYLEFFDKLLTITGSFFIIKLFRTFRHRLRGKNEDQSIVKTVSAALVPALALGTAAAALALCSPVKAYADTIGESSTSYIRTIYNAENGLDCGHANDVAQTNDGILWVGSYAGLYRYNGKTFRLMSELSSVKNVNSLFVDSEGRLWIGTNDNGVVVAINEKESDSIDIDSGLPSNSVRCITQSSDGSYYIGTSESLAVVRLRSGISVTATLDDLLYVKKLSADSKGNVAAVTASGKLYILRGEEIAYEIPEPVDTGYTCAVFGGDDTLYAGTADGKVILMEIGEKEEKRIRTIQCGELSGLNGIYVQDDDHAWVLSDSGMGTITYKKVYSPFEAEGFDFSLENMTVDYDGNVWVASSRMGLMQLTDSVFTDVFGDYGLTPSVVNTTAEKDGMLYIGTDKGLIVLNEMKKNEVSSELTELLSEARVRCIEKDSKNNLWICSYGKGLVELKESGEIKVYDSEKDEIGSRVRVCMELHDGTIAVGGDKGLYFISGDKVQSKLMYGEQLGAAKILCLYEMPDGCLLTGTDGNGIDVIKDGKLIGHYTRENGLSSGVILRMVGDVDKSKVFIAAGNGLCYLSGGEIAPIDNFPYSNNYDIILDDDGEVFIPGSSGIYVVDRDELLSGRPMNYTLLNARSGLRGSLTSNAWNLIDDEKTLYISTDRGVFCVNLDNYKQSRHYYRVMVSEIKLDGASAPAKQGFGMTISKDVSSIEIVPEIVNYTLENPTISYRLEGIDQEDKIVSQDQISHIVYTNLPSGSYVFRIAILDPDTGKPVEESVYGFDKETAIYDNSWFLIYMIVLGLIFSGWLAWFVTSRRIQHIMEIQKTKLALALQQVQMGNETILAIAKTVDAKDARTSQHSQRVSDYSVMIAKEYGFSDEELENLRKAALLHDIGKIGIPDAILNKPARLTDEEYAIMKTHVTRGAEILKDFTLIEHAGDGARFHHERFDGRGYPDHLEGKNIPLYGRIIAIADAFDAMTANRVYRKRQDFDYVMSELHKGRGTQFDPDLLDIFLKLIDDKKIDIDALYASAPDAPDAKKDDAKKDDVKKDEDKKDDGKGDEKK